MPRFEDTDPNPYPQHEKPDPPSLTGRRSLLRWLIHGMGLIVAAILAIPAVAYLIDPRNRAGAGGAFKDVTKLSLLPVGEPREFVIRATIRDAWNIRPNEVVGRVFLIRRNQDTNNPTVEAFTTICPHLGCSVAFTGDTTPGQTAFQCPCHGGRFDVNGHVFPGNVAPRNMDSLPVRVQPIPGDDADRMVQVEYMKFYGNRPTKEEIK
jgi:menaquinol-cytochrome c reductase iron-sulfur subunit